MSRFNVGINLGASPEDLLRQEGEQALAIQKAHQDWFDQTVVAADKRKDQLAKAGVTGAAAMQIMERFHDIAENAYRAKATADFAALLVPAREMQQQFLDKAMKRDARIAERRATRSTHEAKAVGLLRQRLEDLPNRMKDAQAKLATEVGNYDRRYPNNAGMEFQDFVRTGDPLTDALVVLAAEAHHSGLGSPAKVPLDQLPVVNRMLKDQPTQDSVLGRMPKPTSQQILEAQSILVSDGLLDVASNSSPAMRGTIYGLMGGGTPEELHGHMGQLNGEQVDMLGRLLPWISSSSMAAVAPPSVMEKFQEQNAKEGLDPETGLSLVEGLRNAAGSLDPADQKVVNSIFRRLGDQAGLAAANLPVFTRFDAAGVWEEMISAMEELQVKHGLSSMEALKVKYQMDLGTHIADVALLGSPLADYVNFVTEHPGLVTPDLMQAAERTLATQAALLADVGSGPVARDHHWTDIGSRFGDALEKVRGLPKAVAGIAKAGQGMTDQATTGLSTVAMDLKDLEDHNNALKVLFDQAMVDGRFSAEEFDKYKGVLVSPEGVPRLLGVAPGGGAIGKEKTLRDVVPPWYHTWVNDEVYKGFRTPDDALSGVSERMVRATHAAISEEAPPGGAVAGGPPESERVQRARGYGKQLEGLELEAVKLAPVAREPLGPETVTLGPGVTPAQAAPETDQRGPFDKFFASVKENTGARVAPPPVDDGPGDALGPQETANRQRKTAGIQAEIGARQMPAFGLQMPQQQAPQKSERPDTEPKTAQASQQGPSPVFQGPSPQTPPGAHDTRVG